ncbi:uncharacterized protein TNCV_4361321 [Trichonephila clavipes]|nr:uncharacterized protein TNCV_4361321 [Trichonephila clavipes]
MWNPQKAGYLLRNILGSKVVKTNLKGLPYQLFCYQFKLNILIKSYWDNDSPSSYFVNPAPLAHADISRDVLPRGGTSQWCPTRFNLYDPEMRNARGFTVLSEVYFSGSENVTEFLEGIDNQIKLLEIPRDL